MLREEKDKKMQKRLESKSRHVRQKVHYTI